MKLQILGSGGCWGIPAPFCNCKVCGLAKHNPKSKDCRTRPAFLVKTKKGKFLIDVGPDIRHQAAKYGLGSAETFLISQWHFDHAFGFMELPRWAESVLQNRLKIFCSEVTKDHIEQLFPHVLKELIVLKPFEQFELLGVKITAIPVYHMRKMDQAAPATKSKNTFGFILECGGKKIAYLSDYYGMPAKSIKLTSSADLVIADGNYLFEEIFINKKEQNDLKRDQDHLHGKQIFKFIAALHAKCVVFHSINHLTQLTHKELQNRLPKDMLIAYDGMEFNF